MIRRHGRLVPTEDELYHFGVKGMKWGKRKARKEAYLAADKKYRESKTAMNAQISAFKGGRTNSLSRLYDKHYDLSTRKLVDRPAYEKKYKRIDDKYNERVRKEREKHSVFVDAHDRALADYKFKGDVSRAKEWRLGEPERKARAAKRAKNLRTARKVGLGLAKGAAIGGAAVAYNKARSPEGLRIPYYNKTVRF